MFSSEIILRVILPKWLATHSFHENKDMNRSSGLKQQKFTFSRFWRLQIQDQGTYRLGFWWELCSWLVGLLAMSPHDLSFSAYREKKKLWWDTSYCSCKDTNSVRSQPLWPDFTSLPITTLKISSPNSIPRRLRLQDMKFRGTQFSL